MIPVLVGGASVPPAHQLPASIQDLFYRHAIVIRPNPDFHRDMDRLIDYLRTQLDRGKELIVSSIAQSVASDVRGTEEAEYSDADRFGGAGDEIMVRPSGSDSEAHAVKTENEERIAPSVMSQTPTDGFPTMLGGIGLIVLIGAVAAFLILQPKSSPVYSPPVVKKKEERQAQVIPPPSPPRATEPVVIPKKQMASVEKQVIENKPTKGVANKEERAAKGVLPAPIRTAALGATPKKQPAPKENSVTEVKPPTVAANKEEPTVSET